MTHYERPTRYPSQHTAENLTLWHREVDASLAESIATAERWRVGLAGFVSILTGTLIIRGPANVSELRGDWRLLTIALLAIGMVLSIIALWQALAAAAPRLRVQSLDDVTAEWTSLRARNVAVAAAVNRRVGVAKFLTCVALGAILLAIVCWWVAPGPVATATVRTGSHSYCGAVAYDDDSVILTAQDGQVRRVPFERIDRITAGTPCS